VNPIAELVRSSQVIICTGSGGVGKTTIAAVLALEGARQGRRTAVVTIDPAKRLADALGLEGLTNEPGVIEGDWPGELSALMLDTKSTFDALVTKYAQSPAQAERILENRFYRNISTALSATQEFMAMEKLYELHEESDFDLVVVDTPPTRNALDFLDAPGTLTRFLDHPLYKVVMAPTRGILKAVNVATQAFLRTVARVVGSDVINDAIAFFQAFQGMEAGFRNRAARVDELLAEEGTRFVLVASPRRDALDEAVFFADALGQADIAVSALIVNRMHPRFGAGLGEAARERARTLAGSDLSPLYANLADFQLIAGREEDHLDDLMGRVGDATVVRVPFLRSDVHDLDGLQELAGHLFATTTRSGT
jgi:anion-transporting  ArsA/GET3 family ATPase